jgi:3-methyl-2-oxobutanoate hydroxymethyltransferase
MKLSESSYLKRKRSGRPISMLTAYDCPSARILSQSGVDVILVGDSVGTNVLGYSHEKQVTMEDMLHHTAAVARGAGDVPVIADMPYRSYATPSAAIKNARRLIKSGANAVKMEGGARILKQVEQLHRNGIPVCGHLGYLPQSCPHPRVVGKTVEEARQLVNDALALQKTGAFMIVLEMVPLQLARYITKLLRIPTIGIGAGPFCDGQVQVINDILGLSPRVFRHSKMFCQGRMTFSAAVSRYVKEVKIGKFPTKKNASMMEDEVEVEIRMWLNNKFKSGRSPRLR